MFIDAQTSQRQHEIQAEDKAENYVHAARVAQQRNCIPLAAPAKAECVRQESEAARRGQRDEYDLKAQFVMAAWTRAMGIAAIIGMAVGVLGVGLVFVTFRETRAANKIAAKALLIQSRPWLAVEAKIASHIVSDDNGIHFKVEITVRNVGTGIARNVWVNSDAFAKFPGEAAIVERAKAERERVAGNGINNIVVPNGEANATHLYDISRNEIEGALVDDFLMPTISVFATYRGLESEEYFQTAKTFALMQPGPNGARLLPNKRGNMPRAELCILDHPVGGDYAI